jgi:DNA-binding XRE family transcriptional regulator
MSDYREIISYNLKLLRQSRSHAQDDLAREIPINRCCIGSYEEKRAEPSIKTLVRISEIYGISLDALVKKKITLL